MSECHHLAFAVRYEQARQAGRQAGRKTLESEIAVILIIENDTLYGSNFIWNLYLQPIQTTVTGRGSAFARSPTESPCSRFKRSQ